MILLTGGTGFLGSYILNDLLNRGEKVRMLARNPDKVEPRDGLEVVQGDILDVSSLEKAFQGVTKVIHAAAVVSFWPRRREEMFEINVQGTANMVNFSLDADVEKFVHVSSVAAMGRTLNGPMITEDVKWTKSKYNSAYADTKHEAELEVYRGVQEGLKAVIGNPGLILGAGNWNAGSPKLYKTVANGLKFYNPGENGIVSAKDVSRGILTLLDSEMVNGERFLLVSDNIPIKKVLEMIAESLGKKGPTIAPPKFLSIGVGRLSEIYGNLTNKEPLITAETMRNSYEKFQYDGSKITRLLGFEYTSLKDFIQETGKQYLKENGN